MLDPGHTPHLGVSQVKLGYLVSGILVHINIELNFV